MIEKVEDKECEFEWKALDDAIRRWAVQSQFEADVEKYNELKNQQQ